MHTGIYEWASWIRQIAASAASRGGYAAPSWVGGTGTGQGGSGTGQGGSGTGQCGSGTEQGGEQGSSNNQDGTGTNQGGSNQGGTGSGDGTIDMELIEDIDPGEVGSGQGGSGQGDVDPGDSGQDGSGGTPGVVPGRDADGDGVTDEFDNCPQAVNPDQTDRDRDTFGDLCDPDMDGDGIINSQDNCPLVANPMQDAEVCAVSEPESADAQDRAQVNMDGSPGCSFSGQNGTMRPWWSGLLVLGLFGLRRRRRM